MHKTSPFCLQEQLHQSNDRGDDTHLSGLIKVDLLHDAMIRVLLDSSVTSTTHQQV